MPVHVEKRGIKWRVIEPSGRIAKTSSGKPKDGGGHSNRAAAISQVRAINMPKGAKR